jgi:hypothetical protein
LLRRLLHPLTATSSQSQTNLHRLIPIKILHLLK